MLRKILGVEEAVLMARGPGVVLQKEGGRRPIGQSERVPKGTIGVYCTYNGCPAALRLWSFVGAVATCDGSVQAQLFNRFRMLDVQGERRKEEGGRKSTCCGSGMHITSFFWRRLASGEALLVV